MLFAKNQKSELTRVESFALAIAQWCILELLPEELKGRNVFFTQVTVSTVPVNKLDNEFQVMKGREYRAMKVNAQFTTLTEGQEGMLSEKPSIEGEILFRNEGKEFPVWQPHGFVFGVLNYPDIFYYPRFCYSCCRVKGESDLIESRIERFEEFFEKLSPGYSLAHFYPVSDSKFQFFKF